MIELSKGRCLSCRGGRSASRTHTHHETPTHPHTHIQITLLGQNIDAWGRDLTPKQKFSDLLHAVGEVQGIERVRFVTSHPRYMSLNVVDAVASIPNMCEMFHVPFQSGDDDVLREMGRSVLRCALLCCAVLTTGGTGLYGFV